MLRSLSFQAGFLSLLVFEKGVVGWGTLSLKPLMKDYSGHCVAPVSSRY